MIPLHRDSKDHGGGVFSMNTEILLRCVAMSQQKIDSASSACLRKKSVFDSFSLSEKAHEYGSR